MIFNIYDKRQKHVQVNTETPRMCQEFIETNNSKCEKFYLGLSDETTVKGVYVCPYGLCAYKSDNCIYTCLNISDKSDLTKLVPNLKRSKQTPRQFTQYSLSQIIKIVDEYEKSLSEITIRKLTIHDIKNAAKHFIDLEDEIKKDKGTITVVESNDKLLSAVEGYNLIQYLLAYHDKLLNYPNKQVDYAYINLYKAINKLTKILMYRGVKKGVAIELKVDRLINAFYTNKDLYIMYFILIENALKYALENTIVIIKFDILPESGELEIIISNSCYEIKRLEIDNIFIAGFRGEVAMKTSPGNGLGLSVVKRIASASDVSVECCYNSVEDDKGIFSVSCTHKKRDKTEK